MKKLIIMSALVMGGLGIKTADAQLGIRINLHLGTQPVYVPAPQPVVVNEPVYNDDDYYYLPEVEAYYSVGEHSYYYQDGDRWVSAAYLPGRYHDFDWRSAKRFEVRASRPYMHHDIYRGRFGGYVNRNDYYARAYPNRGNYDNNRGHEQYGNREWNQNQNRGNDRRDDRNQNGYNQPAPNRNQGGYNQPGQGQNQGGYNQQNPGRNQGSNQQQPSQGQGQQGSHGNGQGQNQGGGNNSQPTNHSGGQNNSNEHYIANKIGVVQDRGDFARPVRN
ncbi:MAG: hypothetical protein V4592_02270 [Bacteroidota bacterium]